MRRVIVIAVATGLGLISTSGLNAGQVVAPGGLVRWLGEGVESCGWQGQRWLPMEGSCWYPIDLLTPEGPLEIFRMVDGRREEATISVAAYPYKVQRITLEDDSQVNLSSEDLARVKQEQKRISALWGRRGPRRFALPLEPPLESLPAGGRFGDRRFVNDQPRSPHTGADYAADEGVPVLAVADGVVALADDFFFSGQSVFLDHGDGLITMYFHFSDILVGEGEEVRRGQVIGKVGQTGRATGPHLHIGMRWRGARVDPALMLAPVDEIPIVP
ncbi:MAG: M23 family metallopeptidase [Thermoanaerobaculia bacterium]